MGIVEYHREKETPYSLDDHCGDQEEEEEEESDVMMTMPDDAQSLMNSNSTLTPSPSAKRRKIEKWPTYISEKLVLADFFYIILDSQKNISSVKISIEDKHGSHVIYKRKRKDGKPVFSDGEATYLLRRLRGTRCFFADGSFTIVSDVDGDKRELRWDPLKKAQYNLYDVSESCVFLAGDSYHMTLDCNLYKHAVLASVSVTLIHEYDGEEGEDLNGFITAAIGYDDRRMLLFKQSCGDGAKRLADKSIRLLRSIISVPVEKYLALDINLYNGRENIAKGFAIFDPVLRKDEFTHSLTCTHSDKGVVCVQVTWHGCDARNKFYPGGKEPRWIDAHEPSCFIYDRDVAEDTNEGDDTNHDEDTNEDDDEDTNHDEDTNQSMA